MVQYNYINILDQYTGKIGYFINLVRITKSIAVQFRCSLDAF